MERKFAVLAACDDGRRVAQKDLRRVTRTASRPEQAELLQWMADQGIEVKVPMSMEALYHHEPGRRYRPTRREIDSGRFECPGCHVVMVRVTRKAKDPLYQCGGCGWSIARSDIFEPEIGERPELRDDVDYDQGIAPDPQDQPGPW